MNIWKDFWDYCNKVSNIEGINPRMMIEDMQVVAYGFDHNWMPDEVAETLVDRKALIP